MKARPDWGWYRHALAVAHYRASRFERAREEADISLQRDPEWGGHVLNWLVLAMAHHKLGHPDDARAWLKKSLRWIDEADKKNAKGKGIALPLPSWSDRLELQLLRSFGRSAGFPTSAGHCCTRCPT